jgi:hypothetical protein
VQRTARISAAGSVPKILKTALGDDPHRTYLLPFRELSQSH